MGKLENKSKQKTRRRDLQKMILETVATAGILSVALIAPNVIVAMNKLGLIPKRRQKEYISSSASKLSKRGLIFYDGQRYCLTPKGKNILRRWQFADFKLHRPKKWDKKWRVLIFDIPETRRKVRNQLRYLFHQAGLRRLQDSVWVYPYDCEDILTLLKTDMRVGKQVLYLIVDELENDKYLRQEFGLK
ncbi:MAG: CRISPR-associated endonuclease Cas2 [Candidatus Paceibacterota bacterium]